MTREIVRLAQANREGMTQRTILLQIAIGDRKDGISSAMQKKTGVRYEGWKGAQ